MKTFEKSPCDAANETFVTSNRKKRTRPGFRGPQRYLHRCMVQQQETALIKVPALSHRRERSHASVDELTTHMQPTSLHIGSPASAAKTRIHL